MTAFPNSFDTIRNMPWQYTIHLDPNVCAVQHVRCRVPFESYEKIEEKLQKIVKLKPLAPVTQPTE